MKSSQKQRDMRFLLLTGAGPKGMAFCHLQVSLFSSYCTGAGENEAIVLKGDCRLASCHLEICVSLFQPKIVVTIYVFFLQFDKTFCDSCCGLE